MWLIFYTFEGSFITYVEFYTIQRSKIDVVKFYDTNTYANLGAQIFEQIEKLTCMY